MSRINDCIRYRTGSWSEPTLVGAAGSLYEKLICLLRGERIRHCKVEGDVKLTGDADKQSLPHKFFIFFF